MSLTIEAIESAFGAFAQRIAALEARIEHLERPPVYQPPAPPPPPEPRPPAPNSCVYEGGLLIEPPPTYVGTPPYQARIEAIIPPNGGAWTSPDTGHTLVYPIAGEGVMGYAMRVSRQANPGVEPPPHGKAGGLAMGADGQLAKYGWKVEDRSTWPAAIDAWYNVRDEKSDAEWAARRG